MLADKRVLTKRYGPAFLRALPAQARIMNSQDSLRRKRGRFPERRRKREAEGEDRQVGEHGAI